METRVWIGCIRFCLSGAYRKTGEQGSGMVGNISVMLFCYFWMVRRAAVGCDLGWGGERWGHVLVSAKYMRSIIRNKKTGGEKSTPV